MHTILLIEDDAVLSTTLTDNLTQEGFKVIQAFDGAEGLRLAQSAHPDLILLDILLPKINGLAMLRSLRTDEWGKHVPVIILSNLSAQTDVASALSSDVREYLVKVDWKIEDVIKRIREKLALLPTTQDSRF